MRQDDEKSSRGLSLSRLVAGDAAHAYPQSRCSQREGQGGVQRRPPGLGGNGFAIPKYPSTACSSRITLVQLSGQTLNSFGRKYASEALTNLSIKSAPDM